MTGWMTHVMTNGMTPTLAFITGMPGWAEIVVLAFIGVLIFGRRLPDVGRNLGRGIVEFKKGLRGIEDEVDDAVEQKSHPKQIDRDEPAPTIDSKPQSSVRTEPPSHAGS